MQHYKKKPDTPVHTCVVEKKTKKVRKPKEANPFQTLGDAPVLTACDVFVRR
jgi:hypothetical protein